MRVIAAGIALTFLLGVPGAEASWFHRNKKQQRCLPKPIDWPTIRPKMDDAHKNGKRLGRHPEECP